MMEPKGDLPPPLFGHTATVIAKTKVVLFGGVDNKLNMNSAVYIYSIYNNCWSRIQRISFVPSSYWDGSVSESGARGDECDKGQDGGVRRGCWRWISTYPG